MKASILSLTPDINIVCTPNQVAKAMGPLPTLLRNCTGLGKRIGNALGDFANILGAA